MKNNYKYIIYGFCFLVITLIRAFKISQVGLFDYDSAKNLLIIKELIEGNYSNLFHHSSPTFYLLFLPLYRLSESYLLLEVIGIFANVIAVFIALRVFSEKWNLPFWEEVTFFLLVGSSTFLVVSSRYLTIENVSLLLFNLALYFYFLSYQKFKYWWIFSVFLTLAFTVNYKVVLFFPCLLLIELSYRKDKHLIKRFIITATTLVGVFIFYIALSVILELPAFTYLKHLYVQIFARNPNPEITIPLLNFDVFFYLKYIIQFENIAILTGLVVLLIFKLLKKKEESTGKKIIQFFLLFFFVGMSFLAKAPRGLLFIYPLLFLLGYWQFLQLFRSKIIQVGIILICLLWNAWQINEHIYQYADSNYKQVATTLKSSGINTIKTSAALGITPFVFSNTAVEVVFHADSLKPTDQYFLKDDCWKIAKIGAFDKIEGKSLKKWKEPSLCSPFLYLESCEYNNNTYGEALRDWENAKMQEYHLELIDLQ